MTSKQAWGLGLASLASFMMALDSLVVTTTLSTIRQDLTASVESLEWTVNAYNLTFAVLLLTGAALGDRFGRRRMFVVGLAVFTAASVACALSPDIGSLIASRAVQGVGAAMVLPLSLTLISALFPPQQRGRAMGLYLGITGLATFSGPFIGGVIAEGLAWQWIFWLNLPVGLVAILLTARRVDESVGPNNSFDLAGVALVTSGGLEQHGGTGRVRARGSAGTRIRVLGTPHARADAADAVLPGAGVRHGQPGELLRVRLAVRNAVLPRAVLPDCTRGRAARCRSSADAVDRDADGVRTDRRP